MAVVVNSKNCSNDNSGDLVLNGEGNTNSPELSFKFFFINLPSQPFLGRHLGFHIFFHHGFF